MRECNDSTMQKQTVQRPSHQKNEPLNSVRIDVFHPLAIRPFVELASVTGDVETAFFARLIELDENPRILTESSIISHSRREIRTRETA
jgi:hypothetical protein